MSNPRFDGLLLLAVGVLPLAGDTLGLLPPEAFWAGLLYPLGGYLLRGARRRGVREAKARILC